MPPVRKVVLRNFLSPGDIVMLTAAVRDLHSCNPGKFLTDVRTACPALWENNPHITQLVEHDPHVETLECHYPLIHKSNQLPYHFIHAFQHFLSDQLGVSVKPTRFHGDIHLSEEEKASPSVIESRAGTPMPYWIVVAGGKFDYTIKWWSAERFQEVVNSLRNRVLFVQVGEKGHHHPKLQNCIDLRGQTTLRQLIQLVYRAQGVLCPVTFLMHLSAAVESPPGFPRSRPCVVIAGGREPAHWEAYPTHRYLHNIGSLECCESGGCWKARTFPIGDGNKKDLPENLCRNVTEKLPTCMHRITSEQVVSAIESYYSQGYREFLDPTQIRIINDQGLIS